MTSNPAQETLIQQISDYFSAKNEFSLVGIYGSLAAGKLKESSDVDIAIAGVHPILVKDRIDLASELSLLLRREVDLVDLRSVHGVILQEILRSAVWIKKDDPSILGEIVTRFLLDQEDFGKIHDRILKTKRERFLRK